MAHDKNRELKNETSIKNDVLYRYEDGYSDVSSIWLQEYKILRKTEMGVWIQVGYSTSPKYKKWVSSYTVRRFAYPTKKEALFNYIKRKERQILIYTNRIHRAKKFLNSAERKNEDNIEI